MSYYSNAHMRAIYGGVAERLNALPWKGEKRRQGELSKTREGALGQMELRKSLRDIFETIVEIKYPQGVQRL